MKKIKILALSFFAISIFLVSCSEETIDESVVLSTYLESADSPVDILSLNKIISASDLNAFVLTDKAYVIDIRSTVDFSTLGHIAGAINLPAADVVAHLDGKDLSGYEKVVVVCYTGQTSAYVVSLANMAGHEVFSLGFGMSSWNAATAGPWNNGVLNTYATQLETDANPKGESGAMPVIETGYETAEEILDARIDVVNGEGFGANSIDAATVFGALDNYYIVNYWPEENYNKGHIPGAIQYTPGTSMLTTADLMTLPTDKTIVVYCYTGQGSGFLTPYLEVLGYDVKSLRFGINGMATDWAAENEITSWNSNKIGDYPLSFD